METVSDKLEPVLTGVHDLDVIALDAERNSDSYELPEEPWTMQPVAEGPVKFLWLNDVNNPGVHNLSQDPALLGVEEQGSQKSRVATTAKHVGQMIFDQVHRHTIWPFKPIVRDIGDLLGID